MADEPAPKVFISYSWTSDEHVEWVEALATRLNDDGVDVSFDRWDLKQGHDKNAYMESMVTDPNMSKVLCICDSTYAAKADGKKGGVGTESQIISPHVYAKTKQEKFIALAREVDGDGHPILPTFLAHTIYFDFTANDLFEEVYEELIRNIHNAPAKRRPPIGKKPAHLTSPNAVPARTASTLLRLRHAIEQGRPHSHALLDEYFEVFIDALPEFSIKCTNDNQDKFDEAVIDSLERLRSYRDNFVECILLVLRFLPGNTTVQSIHQFLERLIPFQSSRLGTGSYRDVDFDNYRFFNWELFLYLLAGCIRSKQYESAAFFMEQGYHVKNWTVGEGHYESSLIEFNGGIDSLDSLRNQRLKLNLISVAASILKDRAPSGLIAFEELMQADCILFLRHYFPMTTNYGVWYPRCLPYAERIGAADLFARGTTDRGFDTLKTLFGIDNRNELMEGLDAAIGGSGGRIANFRVSYTLGRYLNYSELNRASGRKVKGP